MISRIANLWRPFIGKTPPVVRRAFCAGIGVFNRTPNEGLAPDGQRTISIKFAYVRRFLTHLFFETISVCLDLFGGVFLPVTKRRPGPLPHFRIGPLGDGDAEWRLVRIVLKGLAAKQSAKQFIKHDATCLRRGYSCPFAKASRSTFSTREL